MLIVKGRKPESLGRGGGGSQAPGAVDAPVRCGGKGDSLHTLLRTEWHKGAANSAPSMNCLSAGGRGAWKDIPNFCHQRDYWCLSC